MKFIRQYINLPMLLRIIGWLLIIEGAFMCIPMVTAIIYGEESLEAFLIGVGVCLGAGFIFMSLRPGSREMKRREAMMLTALVWVVFSIFGMVPFLLSGVHFSVTNAFFDTMSSFTTTGLSALPSIDNLPRSFIMWRCVMQWIGGMGIILFTLAVLPMLNYQGGMQMFNAEVTGITHDKLRPRVSSTAKALWLIYIVLTISLMVLLWIFGMTPFDAVCYGMTTMSTGGFATSDVGVHSYDSTPIKLIFSVFMLLGSINFGLVYQMTRGNFRTVAGNTVLRWFLGIVLAGATIMALIVWHSGQVHCIEDVTIDPIFQAISVISSTGLVDPDLSTWGAPALILMMILMFIGGCAGSTSGGAKVDRFVLCVKNIRNEFYRILHPNAVLTIRMNKKGTPEMIIQKSMIFLVLYVLVILASAVTLMSLGMNVEQSFFGSLEAISNTGLGITSDGLSADWSAASDATKWVLSFVMLVGRLELYTVLILFTSTFWSRS